MAENSGDFPAIGSIYTNRFPCSNLATALLLAGLLGLPVFAGDWPQWGRTGQRNMVSFERGFPADFVPGRKKPNAGGIDMATTKNVLWAVRLGTQTYGNPTVAGKRLFVGTDDEPLSRSKRLKRTRGGMVQCFDARTGELLWRFVVPRRKDLPEGAHFTHQWLGICSSPTVEGDRLYVVTSAAEVVCLDVHGLADGNDGPFTNEAQYAAPCSRRHFELGPKDADIIWIFDLIDQAGVCPHDAASNSILIHGDFLYLGTSNGVDEPHAKVVHPDAPALVVLEKHTGKLVAVDGEGISARLYHAQWSSPSKGTVNGRTLIFFGGGDGVCYAFPALEAMPAHTPIRLRAVWRYDCNPPSYKYRNGKLIPYYDGDKRKKRGNKNDGKYIGPSQIIATPVFYKSRVYAAIGQDPAHGRGKGLLHCIDATGKGDITQSGCVWRYDGLDRSISTVAVAGGLLYIPDIAGRLHCLDAESGKVHWVYETRAETWGSPLVADGKVYLGTKKHFWVFQAGTKPRVLAKIRLGSPVFSTAITANGVLYVASQTYLWAVAKSPSQAARGRSRS